MASPRKFSTPSTSHSACRDADDDDYEHADWFTRTFRPISPGSLRAAMFIQMSCCVGAGILTLPAVIVMVGVAPFVGMLTFSAIIAYLNWVNFARVAHTLRETTDIEISWGSIIQHLFGSWGIPALTFMIMIDCLGALVYLLILAGQFLAVVLPDYRTFDSVQPLLPEWFLDLPRDVATVFIPLLFPMFLISLKDLNSLRYIGTYSIFLIVLIIFIVVVNAPAKYFSHNPDKRNIVFFNDSGLKEGLQGISICMWSFLSQWNLYNIIHGMDNHRRFSRVDKVLVRSTFATFCMYLIFGISGYLSFLHHTKGNLLQNYCAKDITLVILKAIFGCQLISVLPFMVWPLRDCVVYFCTEWLGMSSGRFVHGTLGYNLIGFSWLWFAFGCALICPRVTVITSNLGGFCGSTCACVLPIASYYKAILEPRRRALAALNNPAEEGFLTTRCGGLEVPDCPSPANCGGHCFWMTKREIVEMGLLSVGAAAGYTFVASQFYYGFDSDA